MSKRPQSDDRSGTGPTRSETACSLTPIERALVAALVSALVKELRADCDDSNGRPHERRMLARDATVGTRDSRTSTDQRGLVLTSRFPALSSAEREEVDPGNRAVGEGVRTK